ncbi:ABC transporter substrate-binding protein [Undibacterium arcticum]
MRNAGTRSHRNMCSATACSAPPRRSSRKKGIEHVGNSYHSLAEKGIQRLSDQCDGSQTRCIAAVEFRFAVVRHLAPGGQLRHEKNHMTILMAWASGLEQFETLGADICDGVYFGAQYWHAIDSPFNKEFVKFVNSSLTIDPNYSLASSSICTKILLDAIIKANSTDPKAVIAAMEGMKYEGLTGTEEIRKGDHQVLKKITTCSKARRNRKMRSKNDYADIVSFGKSFLPLDKTMCKIA